jgi:hypothetical protein
MLAAIWFGGSGVRGSRVEQIHGLAPGAGWSECLQGPWVDHRR